MKIDRIDSYRQTRPHAYGVSMIFMSSVAFGMMGLAVKLGKGTFRSDTLVFYRSLIQTLVLLPWWKSYFPDGFDPLEKARIHFVRGAVGILGVYTLYLTLKYLPLGMVTQITMTSVIWATVFSWFFLKEKVSLGQIGCALIMALGVSVSLLSHSADESWHFNLKGVAIGLICAMFVGAAAAVLRKMRRNLETREIVFFFGCSGVLLTGPLFLMRPEYPTNWYDAWVLIGVGAFGSIGQLFFTTGFRYVSAFTVTALKLWDSIINILLGALFLSELPPLGFYIGLSLVMAGVVGLTYLRPGVYKKNTPTV